MPVSTVKVLKVVLVNAAIAAVYFATAVAGLRLDAVSGFATLVWPPTGIALAAVLLLGYAYLPGVLVGAFFANFVTGAAWPVALAIAAGNAAEALVGAFLLRRAGFRKEMDRLRDAVAFIALAAIVSTAVSATVGTTALWLAGIATGEAVGPTWAAWWIGDILGNLVVGALLITLFGIRRERLDGPRLREASFLAGTIAFLGLLLFVNPNEVLGIRPPVSYVLFIPVAWAAVRFGPRGSALATFGAATIAVWGTATGHGPFVRETLAEGLLHVQLYIAVMAWTMLILAAINVERRKAEAELRGFNKDLEKKIGERTAELSRAKEELAAFADRTEKRRAVLQAVLQSISEGVAAVDTAGTPIIMNPAAQQITGVEGTELTAPLERLIERTTTFYPDGKTPVAMPDLPIVRALRGEISSNEQYVVKSKLHPAGISVSVNGAPITDEHGDIVGGVIVLRELPQACVDCTLVR